MFINLEDGEILRIGCGGEKDGIAQPQIRIEIVNGVFEITEDGIGEAVDPSLFTQLACRKI